MKPEVWIVNGEVGTSSKTIWAVMMGVVRKDHKDAWRNYDVPHDPDDLQRCVKLLTLIPEWRERLSEVAEAFPQWLLFVKEWDRLEKMCWKWIADNYGQEDKKHAETLYQLIQSCRGDKE